MVVETLKLTNLLCHVFSTKLEFSMSTQARVIGSVAAFAAVVGLCSVGEKLMASSSCQKQYKLFEEERQPQDALLADVYHGVRHADWSTDEHGPLAEEKTPEQQQTSTGTDTTLTGTATTEELSKVDVVTSGQTSEALASLDK